MSGSNQPWWLSWIAPILTACAAVWALARLLFVTRGELAEILERSEQRRESQRLQLHHENLAKFDELFERQGEVERGLARVIGRLER